MKKTLKKLVACVLVVLMAVSAMPFTALADDSSSTIDYTLSLAKTGVIDNDGSRYSSSNNTINIVNDCQDSNFSIGFWQYDLSEIETMDARATSATMSISVPSAPLDDCQGLSFYFVQNDAADTLSNGENTVSSLFGQGDSTHTGLALTYYDLYYFGQVAKANITSGGTITLDVSSALNMALDKGLDNFTIMVMQSLAGGSGSTNGWTDTKLTCSGVNIATKLELQQSGEDAGLTALKTAISAYETKMQNINTENVIVYKNMADAYQAYIKACRYRDAYEYGGSTTAYNDLSTVTSDLRTKTAAMTPWTDTVTGQYSSAIPSFTNTSTSDMQSYTQFYGNILYTESCTSGNSGRTTGENSGASVIFDTMASTQVQVYYPNTVLLYDGSSNKAKLPICFMARQDANKKRYVNTVYPAAAGASSTYTTTMPGNDSGLQSLAFLNGDETYDWKGNDGNNTLDFDYGRGSCTSYVGSSSGNPNGRYSDALGYAWSSGYWNCYATAFQVPDTIDFAGEGYKEVAQYWAWYGGSVTTSPKSVDSTMVGYKEASHHIYVLNYKGLADAIKNTTYLNKINNVSNYTEGGLLSVLQAYDTATSFSVSGTTTSNVAEKGKTIKNAIAGIKAAVTEDSNKQAYSNLKTALSKATKVYEKGNVDNENYTAESWEPFATAYEAAKTHFANLVTNNFDSATAATLVDPLTTAQKGLVVNKEVIDTTVLQYAIDNADSMLLNSEFFVSGTVPTDLEETVTSIKEAIWGSVENYGLDSEKLSKTTENQALADGYLEDLTSALSSAQINTNAVVSTYSYSLETAITAAAAYESTKGNYSNYASLETAVNNAKSFKENIPTINAKVEGQVKNTINTYTQYVDAIGYAIKTLRPSFTLIENGTIAHSGKTVTTKINSSARQDEYYFTWDHTTDIVYFKTEREAVTWQLPTSKWGSYNKQTGSNFDTVLDSINLHAMDVDTAELTSKSASFLNTVSDYGLSATQIEEHPGNLSIQNGNLTLTLNNFKVTTGTGQALGIDAAGNNISDSSYDFTTLLSTTEGQSPRVGGIYALNGTTVFTSSANISVPATTGAANATNKPSYKSRKMDLAGANTDIGITYFWRYAPTLMQNWAGYSFDKTQLSLTVGVVDLCIMFELIDEVESESFIATANNYTTTSWNNLTKAISNAKSDMRYGDMTYDEIVSECDNRYTALLTAKNSLKAPASNTALKEAVQNAKSVYENDQSKVDPTTWTAFASAYEAALAKYTGEYSDTGVRDYETSEQSKIDAYATALTDAQAALAYRVDFTPVDNAVVTLINSIEDEKYTATSIAAVETAISNLTYFNMSEAERLTHYNNETEFVAAVTKEATVTIPAIANNLVKGTVDASALIEAKNKGRESLSDPDAYDQDQINEALSALTEFTDVTLMGKTISAYKYDTQAQLDADVTKALSGINIQQYFVSIDGVQEGTYDFGTTVTINSTDGSVVDWYYYSQSNTSETAKKYFSTGSSVTFVVRGNTVLTTKKADEAKSQVKVTYYNSANSRILDVAYVTAGSTVELSDSVAPKTAYYKFVGFVIDGQTYQAGATITVDKDTNITAKYAFDETATDRYTVFVADLSYGYDEANFSITDLKYNDEVSITREGYKGLNAEYTVNGETRTATDSGRAFEDYGNPEVYAWVEVGSDDLDDLQEWFNQSVSYNVINGSIESDRAFGSYAGNTLGKVVAYGTDYTFRVHKNVALLPLDKYTYDLGVAQGVITDTGDENGASVSTQSDLVITSGTKFSMISSFTLPENCNFVEAGILFVADKNSSTAPTATLTLGNVGNDGVVRIKSTSHTAGNQYVISITSTALSGKQVGDVGMSWVAYMIYTDANGDRVTTYSPVTHPTNTEASF